MECVIDGKEVVVTGRFLKTARLRSEAHVPLEDPLRLVEQMKGARLRADIFTFVQSVTDRAPKHPFPVQLDQMAVLPLTTYDDWYTKKLYNKPRNMVRKALKSGVEIRLEDLSEPLVQGIKAIYDESPIIQGKRNYHYMEDLETVKKAHSRYLDRSQFITAYYSDQLVGFAKVTFSAECGFLINFASMISHRDKAVSSALLAKVVEICADRKSRCLVYGVWGSGGTRGLVEFKVANGFECVEVPRYYVPLTWLGSIALKAGVHQSVVRKMPAWSLEAAAKMRKGWNMFRVRRAQA